MAKAKKTREQMLTRAAAAVLARGLSEDIRQTARTLTHLYDVEGAAAILAALPYIVAEDDAAAAGQGQ